MALPPRPAVFRAAHLLLALLVISRPLLRAQAPVFQEMPDAPIRYLVAAHPEMPVHTSHNIAAIEANAPSYLAASEKTDRYYWLNRLIAIETERLKPSPDLRRYWYEFVQAKAPALTESEIDAIAQDWWSANGFRAVKHNEPYGLRDATFKEVRAHFQILRTGSEAHAIEAKHWLIMAQMGEGWKSLRLPSQAQDISPLAHLLARDISEEARRYTGAEAAKLRSTLASLLAGRFTIADDAGIEHPVSGANVDALMEALSSGDQSNRRGAMERLEEWLKMAVEKDLKRYTEESAAHPRPH